MKSVLMIMVSLVDDKHGPNKLRNIHLDWFYLKKKIKYANISQQIKEILKAPDIQTEVLMATLDQDSENLVRPSSIL